MGGPGNNSREGNAYRNADGTTVIEWAFANFTTLSAQEPRSQRLPLWGGNQPGIYGIPIEEGTFTAPKSVLGPTGARGNILKERIVLREGLRAPIQAGDPVGTIEYTLEGRVVHTVPLVSDRSVEPGSLPLRLLDRAASWVLELLTGHS
jgi:D-alanyl-D-alanine carboxypeptidase (penicillin-binding protein 5/6)